MKKERGEGNQFEWKLKSCCVKEEGQEGACLMGGDWFLQVPTSLRTSGVW